MSRHCLSVITTCAADRTEHLADTAASVARAQIRLAQYGWRLTWLFTLSGTCDTPPDIHPDIYLAAPRVAGIAAGRNRALVHLADGWVYPLDADDLLDADGLAALVCDPRLEDQTIGWIGTSRTLLDGSSIPYTFQDEQYWPRWSFGDSWPYPSPFHANSLLVRSDLLLQLGGWPAMTSHEDLGLLFDVADAADGLALPYPVTRFRTWSGQASRDLGHDALREESLTLIAAVANARRRAAGRTAGVDVPNAIARDALGFPVQVGSVH